ncbi:transposase [Streptomyces sp. NPDC020951]|uniref:transposase n=1 Tax=Streptomyces sp. NPDC020951 TaxID=3365104 RepID=UPI0037BB176B
MAAVLAVVRLGPDADAVAVTAHQLRQVVERLIRAGQWQHGDRDVLVVLDAGYDVMRLAWLLSDPPAELAGRLRSDRVLRLPKPPRVYDPKGGRPPKHGPEFRLAKPETWPEPAVVTMNDAPRYDKTEARAWYRVHPRLTHRSARIDVDG